MAKREASYTQEVFMCVTMAMMILVWLVSSINLIRGMHRLSSVYFSRLIKQSATATWWRMFR